MKIDKVIKLQQQFGRDVHNIYENADRFRWPDKQILEALKKCIYENEDYKKMPRYAKEFVYGIIWYLRERHWTKVAFTYEIDGKRMFIHDPKYRKLSPRLVHEKYSHTGCFCYKTDITKPFTFPELETEQA